MIEDKAVETLSQLEALARQYTPDVIDAAINVTRIDGVAAVVGGMLMLVCVWPVCVAGLRLHKFFSKKQKEDRYSDWELGVMSVQICTPMAIALLVIFGAVLVLDVWNWVAIFEPKLFIAKQIMGF